MRKVRWALAAIALGAIAGTSHADQPADNLALATGIANQVKTSGSIAGYALDVEANSGVVVLSGTVADAAQKADVLNMVRNRRDVVAVLDRMTVADDNLALTTYQEGIFPGTADTPLENAVEGAVGAVQGAIAGAEAATDGYDPAMAGVPGGPAPLRTFPGGLIPYTDSPTLPPYAWPAYTPYNNYAQMAYQTQYPSGAWPFIGPPHPYPMIPSGWRNVSLKWKKGYWFLKFNAH